MDAYLAIFTRYPRPGATKTRLIPALGCDGAAELQREMTRHTLCWAQELRRAFDVFVEVVFEGGDERLMSECFGADFSYRPQGHGDLGDRMARTFRRSFGCGVSRAVIVGTDCPDMTAGIAREAFDALQHTDLVIGPAADGGYYLIGLRRQAADGAIPELFRGIAWGTGEVLDETLRIAAQIQFATDLLVPLDDIDRPEDLHIWQEAARRHSPDCQG